jgi:hypothetical protein
MCRFLTDSLIIVRVSHCHHNRPDDRWGNIAEHYKLTIVLEFRQQVEAIEPDRLPCWLPFHPPFIVPPGHRYDFETYKIGVPVLC